MPLDSRSSKRNRRGAKAKTAHPLVTARATPVHYRPHQRPAISEAAVPGGDASDERPNRNRKALARPEMRNAGVSGK